MDPSLTADTGLLKSLSVAFAGGLAASFTPCVYPLIPVTLAIFGATADVPRSKAFLLSATYVLGIALTYTALGIFSAFTGALFGQALGNPWVIAGMCLFLITMSLYTLEIINFDVAYKLQTRASQVGGKGFFGAFLMGAVSGVVAAPCAAPILITILGIAATTRNPWLGGGLLFAYALGFGLIFLLLGTFSGLLRKLPKSGNWLHMVKFFISVALLMVAFFLLQPFLKLVNETYPFHEHVEILLVFGVIAFFIASIAYRRNLKSLRFVSAAVLSFTLFHLFIPPIGASREAGATANEALTWQKSIDEVRAFAQKEQRPIMVDFFAEWCAACKELDAKTFRSPLVVPELNTFALARIDMTVATDETDKLQAENQLVGLPSLLFFRSDGTEIKGMRIEGFKEPAEFLDHLKQVKEKSKIN